MKNGRIQNIVTKAAVRPHRAAHRNKHEAKRCWDESAVCTSNSSVWGGGLEAPANWYLFADIRLVIGVLL